MVASPNQGKNKKRVGADDGTSFLDPENRDVVQKSETPKAEENAPTEVNTVIDNSPVKELADDEAPKKKKRRRRRRKKKKTEDVEAPNDSDQAVDEQSLDDAQPVIDDIVDVQPESKVEKTDEVADNPFDEPVFPADEPVESPDTPQPEQTAETPDDDGVPDFLKIGDQQASPAEASSDNAKDDSAIWDSFDPGGGTSETTPDASDAAPELDQSAAEPAQPQSEVKPEPQETLPEKPAEQEKAATPQSADAGDVPDWLKAVPSQDWQSPKKEEAPADPFIPPTPAAPSMQSDPAPTVEPIVPEAKPASMPEAAPKEQITEKKADSVVVEPEKSEPSVEPSDPVLGPLEVEGSFSDKMKEVFDEAGVSMSSVIRGIVIIIVILVGGYFLYKGGAALYGWFTTPTAPPAQEERVPVDNGETVPVDQPITSTNFGVGAGEIFGYWDFGRQSLYPVNSSAMPAPQVAPETGPKSGQRTGEILPPNIPESLQQYVFTLKEIQNAFDTDIYALLDRSTERLLALNNHINLMILLDAKSKGQMQELDVQLAAIEQKFNDVTAKKKQNETEFFTNLRQLEPSLSEERLNTFTDLSQEQVVLKAHFQARKKIRRYFDLLLENLNNRRRDYELNKDALVKGVKVVDVKKSDINLILQD